MFLGQLKIPEPEKVKLATLGSKSALDLLALKRASPEAFDQFIGASWAREIERQLLEMLSEEDHLRLAAPLPARRPLGARLPSEDRGSRAGGES